MIDLPQKKTFETNIEELEKIIADLENGDAPLDKCIEMFEKGVSLSGECLKMIDNAKQKITLLTEKGEAEFKSDADNEDE